MLNSRARMELKPHPPRGGEEAGPAKAFVSPAGFFISELTAVISPFRYFATPIMQLLLSQSCEYYECTRQPTYGMDGQRAKFCSSHKEDGMIDVKNCRCKHPGCTRQPNYGHEGGRAKYCSSHKLAKMVNVVSRRCEFPACKRQVGRWWCGPCACACSCRRWSWLASC